MKDQEERELNGELTSNKEECPGEQGNGEKTAEKSADEQDGVPTSSVADCGQDGEQSTDNSVQTKESQPFDTAQGALGQVKAKVEVCKDESIGKGFSDNTVRCSFLCLP